MRKQLALVGLVLLVIALGFGSWLWWFLGPGAPPQPAPSALPPVPPLPENPRDLPPPPPSEPELVPPAESLKEDMPIGPIDRGTLVVEARGQRLGTETYTLERRQTGELSLHSEGTLNFKIAFFAVQATFVQAMTFTAARRPVSYQLALSGPIGIGDRKVSASFGATTGIVNDGERQTEIALPEESFIVLGMFSSYVILPLWVKPDLPQKLKVISMRGDRGEGGPEIWVTLERVRSVQLQAHDASLILAEEYLLKSERFTLKLYLSGERLLALQNDAPQRNESFRLYRSDLFPQGFEVLSEQN